MEDGKRVRHPARGSGKNNSRDLDILTRCGWCFARSRAPGAGKNLFIVSLKLMVRRRCPSKLLADAVHNRLETLLLGIRHDDPATSIGNARAKAGVISNCFPIVEETAVSAFTVQPESNSLPLVELRRQCHLRDRW